MSGTRTPGIVQCGLWEELENRPPLPTAALVTDIGNDIIYGCSVGPITRWLETCLQRLADQVERLVVTRLPIDVVSDGSRVENSFTNFASLPRLSPQPRGCAASKHSNWTNNCSQYANRFGAYVVQPDSRWYTWDPIHIARRHRPAAWQKYMTCWSQWTTTPPSHSFIAPMACFQTRTTTELDTIWYQTSLPSTNCSTCRWNDDFSFLSPFSCSFANFFLNFLTSNFFAAR